MRRTVGAVYRFVLTPRWWGINLFAVLAIPVCLLMGSWQLSRFDARVAEQKEQQRTQADAEHARPAPLRSLLPVDQRTSGRVAEAAGRYDTRHQLLVPGRRLAGKRGYYVLTLLRPGGSDRSGRTGEGSGSGKALPVVRGWLPGRPDPARVPAPPRGTVRVTGALQASESPDSPGVRAEGGLPKGQLGMISAASLVNVVPYGVHDAWITVQHPPEGSPLRPVPPVRPQGSGLDVKAFQNLGYTGEWFVFAGFVVFMWFRLFRRDAELEKDRALGLVPENPDETEGDGENGAAAGTGSTGPSESGPADADSATRSRPPESGGSPEGDAGRSRSPASTA